MQNKFFRVKPVYKNNPKTLDLIQFHCVLALINTHYIRFKSFKPMSNEFANLWTVGIRNLC